MLSGWPATTITVITEAMQIFTELRGKRWLCRGQSRCYGSLTPSIDRDTLKSLPRAEKLALERRAIDTFRSTARFFSDGEQSAMNDDVVALMVLRHYGVPTRILDWSWSPFVAAYFAAHENDGEDGEIWAFDEPLYEKQGSKQWQRWPETTIDGSGDPSKWGGASLTAFTLAEPPNWFICGFYSPGFHRQNAQQGAYTMTARFGRDHAAAIAELLENPDRYHRYVVAAELKPKLRTLLRENHGVWRGSLFPDSAGAAETSKSVFLEASNTTMQPTICAHRSSHVEG
jgi:hypothetical protein